MEDKKIGIISDTHDLLRDEVIEKLKECDAILHAGDISSPEILDELKKIAGVYAVRGNADEGWGDVLPVLLETELYGLKICMAHKKKDLPADLSNYDVVITGHTHKYSETKKGNVILLNPGSCGPRKQGQPVTMAVLHISGNGCIPEKIELPNGNKATVPQEVKAAVPQEVIMPEDMKPIVEKTIKLVKKRKTVDYISEHLMIPKDLAERIVRIYLTHPGVTADGILGKMGI